MGRMLVSCELRGACMMVVVVLFMEIGAFLKKMRFTYLVAFGAFEGVELGTVLGKFDMDGL